jgi:hypothetical protein
VSALLGDRPALLAALAIYALAIGAVSSVLGVIDTVDGRVPAAARTVIGLVGIAGGALLWQRPFPGSLVCLLWAVMQIPYFAWNLEGSPFSQFIDVPLGASSQTTRNGEVTSYSYVGINLVGVGLTVLAARVRSSVMDEERRRRLSLPEQDTSSRELREIEDMRRRGEISREEANQRRAAVLRRSRDETPDSG